MSEIGFVIITHSAPHQFVRLISVLNRLYSNPPIVIHHDFDQCPAQLSLPSNVNVVQPHIATKWCDFSVVRATMASLAVLYANLEKPEWFVLLSGSCYPTKGPQAVISDLAEGGYDAYIDHQLIDPTCIRDAYRNECFRRYFSWQIALPSLGRRITLGVPSLAALRSTYSRNGHRCYAGSQWFTANRKVAEYILSSEGRYSWLRKHLRNRHCPDETYFQTILCNAPQFRLSTHHYRFIDWSSGRSHPKLLELCDLPSILASPTHFARKFAPNSPVLNQLDRHLGLW